MKKANPLSGMVAFCATRTDLYLLTFPLWIEEGRDFDILETFTDIATEARGQGISRLNTVDVGKTPFASRGFVAQDHLRFLRHRETSLFIRKNLKIDAVDILGVL